MELTEKASAGDRPAISRLLSEVENETPLGQEALEVLYPRGGRAAIIGITGPSGSGKSTLVNRLALTLAAGENGQPNRVGIIAVDPSSPFSGGALLGDRVRMRDLGVLPNVFIRSMATRGALGGLARAADGAVQVLDAAGFDLVLIETVGAGQSEVDIARLAHTTLVVEAPGLGDDVQAAKAGILEIADILVLNKADKPGAQAAARSLRSMLEFGAGMAAERQGEHLAGWSVPLVQTSALDGTGVGELKEVILAHQDWLRAHGGLAKKNRARITDMLERSMREHFFNDWQAQIDTERYQSVLADVVARRLTPRQALASLLEA